MNRRINAARRKFLAVLGAAVVLPNLPTESKVRPIVTQMTTWGVESTPGLPFVARSVPDWYSALVSDYERSKILHCSVIGSYDALK